MSIEQKVSIAVVLLFMVAVLLTLWYAERQNAKMNEPLQDIIDSDAHGIEENKNVSWDWPETWTPAYQKLKPKDSVFHVFFGHGVIHELEKFEGIVVSVTVRFVDYRELIKVDPKNLRLNDKVEKL